MDLAELEKQRKELLLKKSKGDATKEDLEQLIKILDLISQAQPSIAEEITKPENTEDPDSTKS